MLRKWIFFIVVLSFATPVFAQHTQEREVSGNTPDSWTCSFYRFSSGIGINETEYCVMDTGNVVLFSRPSDTQYMFIGSSTVEGYAICDLTGSKSYHDYGPLDDSGNWQLPVVTVLSSTKLKVVRATSDGTWELTQTIAQIKATGSSPGAAQVTMSLKNLSGSKRDVYLLRVANLWVDRDHPKNYFDFTWNTAIGSFPGRSRFGLSLTNNTSKFPHYSFTQNTPFGPPDPCQPSANWNWEPWLGQGSMGQLYHHTVRAGSTMSVTMTYRPM